MYSRVGVAASGTDPAFGWWPDRIEVAGMVAYLVSAEAALVTGTSLTINGGFVA
jgi:NAD(P)-dependent dehydrogenase (short-subunit alcohol dehydrogenase family)